MVVRGRQGATILRLSNKVAVTQHGSPDRMALYVYAGVLVMQPRLAPFLASEDRASVKGDLSDLHMRDSLIPSSPRIVGIRCPTETRLAVMFQRHSCASRSDSARDPFRRLDAIVRFHPASN